MYQYLSESFLREHVNQFLRAIPTVKSDWILSQVNTFLLKEAKHFMEHVSEYVGFGCISSTLFLSIHKVCTNLFFRCTAEREWLGVNMSKICPEASINKTSIALIAF
jgi:hypothetical protein